MHNPVSDLFVAMGRTGNSGDVTQDTSCSSLSIEESEDIFLELFGGESSESNRKSHGERSKRTTQRCGGSCFGADHYVRSKKHRGAR